MVSANLNAHDSSQQSSFALPNLPVTSSAQARWTHLQLVHHRQPATSIPEHHSDQHTICINMGNGLTVERIIDGKLQRIEALPVGEVGIYPAQLRQAFQWHQEAEYILLYLDPLLLAQVQTELFPHRQVALMPYLDQGVDPLIYQMAIALKTSLEIDGSSSRFYADTMAHALTVHLLTRYCTDRVTVQQRTGRLSAQQIQQVVDYIHEYLNQDISLAELANIVQLSSYHFTRLFKQSMGIAPHQYHIRCRVDRAKQLLRENQLSLSDIAYYVGFTSQGHLNYHFKRWVGVTPKVFLRQR